MNRRIATLLLLLVGTSQPAWAFYCGHELVMEGDYKLQVLQKCGAPTYQESRVEYRGAILRGSGQNQPGVDFIRQDAVNIDEWTYDFGPHRFMQWLYFENGRLLLIKDLSYGSTQGQQ